MIGTPNESDKSFVTDQKALEYLESFPIKPKIDFKKMYPGAPVEALDFLQKALVFNPYFRITIEECLSHPFFSKVRKEEKEKSEGVPVSLEFEKLDLD